MKTKLLQTKDYLLLIDEEAYIKEGSIAIYDFGMGYDLEIPCDKDNLKSNTRKLVVAYYPLTKEAKELDLPLLPNPFKDSFDISTWSNEVATKQFSLEDVKEAFVKGAFTDLFNTLDISKEDFAKEKAEQYIQSISTQQLPRGFEPLIEIYNFDHGVGRSCIPRKTLKTITNSEGKEELVGTYKY